MALPLLDTLDIKDLQRMAFIYSTSVPTQVGIVVLNPDGSSIAGGSGGSGTVTTVSVVTANGVSGTVANPTTTPAITITLGAITPTTVNGNTFTTGTGTLTLGAGKTATISNTLTLTGTDASSVAFGAGGTVAYTANNLSVFAATTSAQLAGVISDETGSGLLVFATSPTLVTPTIGVATATSINKVTITAPATSAVLTIINAKTFTVNNTLALSGTDSTTMTFPTTSATIARTDAAQTFTGAQTFASIIDANNAATVAANAVTVPVTSRLTTITNNAAGAVTITLTTAGATNGQLLLIRFYDFSAAAQTLTWINTENSLTSVPSTSNGSTTLPVTVALQFNGGTTKWRCIASS